MIGYPGLNCAQCGAFIATKNDDNALHAKVVEEWAKLNKARPYKYYIQYLFGSSPS